MIEPLHHDELVTLYLGDCVAVMAELPADSVDAIVCDPPYGLEFMGKDWDRLGAETVDDPASVGGFQDGAGGNGFSRSRVRFGAGARTMQAWHEAWAREALRVAKPGAHLLAFGGTRTYHRLASAIEDAGWEIRDCLVWAYASGFPKSHDVSKAIDRAAGAERPTTGVVRPVPNAKASSPMFAAMTSDDGETPAPLAYHETTAATDEARRWEGWGTALKPAWEPIVMARKPLAGTVARNVLAHGTGALNIDATRLPGAAGDGVWGSSNETTAPGFNASAGKHDYRSAQHQAGRWPPNVLLTDPIFDGGVPGVVGGGTVTSGTLGPEHADNGKEAGTFGAYGGRQKLQTFGGDSGTYSRFFLVPKSSRSDREPVLRGQLEPRRPPSWSSGEQSPGTFQSQPTPARENVHPTVKPLELMRHLVRLVTPPGGVVLDCFLGSGTTAIAANAEGFRAIGIERAASYLEIARARLMHQPLGLELDRPAAPDVEDQPVPELPADPLDDLLPAPVAVVPGQVPMFEEEAPA